MIPVPHVQAWRTYHRLSIEELAQRSGVAVDELTAIEEGLGDPSVGTLARLAAAMGMSVAWLHGSPQDLQLLRHYTEEDDSEVPSTDRAGHIDPILERMIRALRQDRTLYALVTVLMQSGDERLLRAAEVSLRSLVKQVKPVNVPWLSRPPGHFEPPSD